MNIIKLNILKDYQYMGRKLFNKLPTNVQKSAKDIKSLKKMRKDRLIQECFHNIWTFKLIL